MLLHVELVCFHLIDKCMMVFFKEMYDGYSVLD